MEGALGALQLALSLIVAVSYTLSSPFPKINFKSLRSPALFLVPLLALFGTVYVLDLFFLTGEHRYAVIMFVALCAALLTPPGEVFDVMAGILNPSTSESSDVHESEQDAKVNQYMLSDEVLNDKASHLQFAPALWRWLLVAFSIGGLAWWVAVLSSGVPPTVWRDFAARSCPCRLLPCNRCTYSPPRIASPCRHGYFFAPHLMHLISLDEQKGTGTLSGVVAAVSQRTLYMVALLMVIWIFFFSLWVGSASRCGSSAAAFFRGWPWSWPGSKLLRPIGCGLRRGVRC